MPTAGQTRTPFGGMNQDDSLITPAKDAAGKNMFEIGDYRYALNARIGSSRSDNFGDLENIRSTVEVTDYYAIQPLFENTDFDGDLSGWSQLDEDPDYIEWTYNANAARASITPDLEPVAPEFIAKGSAGATNTASVNVTYPAGIQAGDLLIMHLFSYQEPGGSVGDINTPTGWTPCGGGVGLRSDIPETVATYKAFSRVATGSETGTVAVSRTGSTGTSNQFYGQMYQFRAPNIEVVGFANNLLGDGASTIAWNAVGAGGDHRTIIALVGQLNSEPDVPSGYTEEASDVAGGVTVYLKCGVKEDTNSGASTTAPNGDAGGWGTIHIAIVGYDAGPTPFVSEVIYQDTDVPIAGKQVDIQFNLVITGGPITSGQMKLVYLDGTNIISEEIIDSGALSSVTYNETKTLPANTNGIGFRVQGTTSTITHVDLHYFKVLATFASQSERPDGDEIVIGKFEDYEFQRLYYCVWNSLGNHCIRYWDAVNNYIVEVLQWSGLNWLSTDFVKMTKLDNWMAFTDRRNPPRLIDVDKVGSLKAELGDEFREFHISFHKWAPTVPPIPRVYYDGVTNNFDRLKDKVYHFSYRYIYDGNLRSCWSPISKGATTIHMKNTYYANQSITAIEVDIPGAILDQPGANTEYNYFDHTDIKFTAAVRYIELAFREGELELWKLWKRVPVNPSFNRYHYFNGDGLLTPIPQEEFNQPFDTVPFLAGTVEAIDNRFVFGDCLDEKPPVTGFEVSDVDQVYDLDQWNDPRTTSYSGMAAGPRARFQRFNALSKLTFKDRTTYKLGIQFLYPSGWRTGVYTSENWLYTLPDAGDLSSGIDNVGLNFTIPDNVTPPEGAVGYQIMRTNSLDISYYIFGICNKISPLIDDVSAITDELDVDDNVKARIQEHFRNVQNLAGDEVIAYTEKVLQEEIDANASRDKKIRRRNRFLRRNTVFNFATSGVGHGLFTAQLERWGRRTPIGPMLQAEMRKLKSISVLADASRLYIDIANWMFGAHEDTDKEFPYNNIFYNYTQGDRVRFYGSESADPSESDIREYDVPIIEYTGRGLIIEKPEGLQWVSDGSAESEGPFKWNIEVYTPKRATEADHVFYEMGEWYPILYPGHANRDFAKRDFVFTAAGDITVSEYGPFDIFHKVPVYYGDSYNVGKTVYRDDTGPGDVSSPMLVSMNPDINKTYDYWDKNNGRPAIGYDELPVERFKTTMARFSGRIIEESFVNNLNNMREEDQYIYPSEYGRIRDLVNTTNAQVESVGSILLAIGEREAWSIYVNRTTLEDLSGRSQVALSDDVLGSYNTLLGSHGTMNPESVSRNRGRVYWWDAIDGSWIRYGRDGLTEISEYKMRNWFSEFGDLVITKYLTDEKPKAISEFDPFNRELITFQNHSTLPSTFRGYSHYKGAFFSEDDIRWKGCHNFEPEMMGKVNNQVVMFKNGSVYLYEKDAATHSTFFGVKYDVQWEPVFNDMTDRKKAWKSIAIISSDKWSVERILSEYRGLRSRQQTSVPISDFEEREDNLYAALRRDVNTPNISNPTIEGDEMKSKAIQVLMQLDPSVTHLSLLHFVTVVAADSPKNP